MFRNHSKDPATKSLYDLLKKVDERQPSRKNDEKPVDATPRSRADEKRFLSQEYFRKHEADVQQKRSEYRESCSSQRSVDEDRKKYEQAYEEERKSKQLMENRIAKNLERRSAEAQQNTYQRQGNDSGQQSSLRQQGQSGSGYQNQSSNQATNSRRLYERWWQHLRSTLADLRGKHKVRSFFFWIVIMKIVLVSLEFFQQICYAYHTLKDKVFLEKFGKLLSS